jgi:Cu(I)/Ag(I) efflux system membrane protein CusA/SilA
MPIKGRIDMLATGIRTPVGIKIFGPDLAQLEQIGREIERAINMVPGTRSVFAERALSGYYLDVDIDRVAAARYGLNIEEIQSVLASAVGGMTITQTVEGRERYAVRLRYPHELRDQPEKLGEVLLPVAQGREAAASAGSMGGMAAPARTGAVQIPLAMVATIQQVSGPMAIKTEGAFPTAWVYVDVMGRDIGGYVREAKSMVANMITLPPGYTLQWSGQYEYMQRASRKLMPGGARHARDHLPAAVHELPQCGRDSDRDVVTARLQLVGGNRDRLHRAGRAWRRRRVWSCSCIWTIPGRRALTPAAECTRSV